MRVFLSYTRKKDQFSKVSSFRDRLEVEIEMRSPGSCVFQDKKHLQEGSHFPDVITDEINRSDVLLALVSPAWLASEWCRREFALFTADATDGDRLHKILPVLWVDTPNMNSRSLDLVARTMANISYADWRDLRYENWDDSKNQRQLGRLAESAVALRAVPATQGHPPSGNVSPVRSVARLSAEKEVLLIVLEATIDGLAEDRAAQLAELSHTRASVYLHQLQTDGYVRQRLRTGQRIRHWLINTQGQSYLVENNLVA